MRETFTLRLRRLSILWKRLFIRELKAPTMGRARWVRRLNREIIDNFLLRTEEDVIHNIHPRYYNPTAQRTNDFNTS